MGEILECKHCGQRLKWQRCIIHLKRCHNIAVADVNAHYNKIYIQKGDNQTELSEKVRTLSVHSKKTEHRNISKATKKSKQQKEYSIKCTICGAIINKQYRAAHYSTVHNIGVPDVFKHKSQGRKNPKSYYKSVTNESKKRCILCGEIMTEGVELKHLKVFHSNIDIKELGTSKALVKFFISASKPFSGWAQKVGIDKTMAADNYNKEDYKPVWTQILYHRNGGK